MIADLIVPVSWYGKPGWIYFPGDEPGMDYDWLDGDTNAVGLVVRRADGRAYFLPWPSIQYIVPTLEAK